MTSPTPADSTSSSGGASRASADDAATGVRGGPADRLDAAPGSGGVPAAGADGATEAREQMRSDLGERSPEAGTEDATSLEQAAAVGPTDDPQGGSLQPGGASGA
ncbi:MAG TPA: hypothetical protein VNU66_06120 [Mycobacteriales bacterium]|nr:hypothetical protein [Mycobacteriales bacterium]